MNNGEVCFGELRAWKTENVYDNCDWNANCNEDPINSTKDSEPDTKSSNAEKTPGKCTKQCACDYDIIN